MPQQSRSQRRRQPTRTQQRRFTVRPAPAPVDYSQDYAYVRNDLIWIAIWATMLLIGMVVVSFVM